MSYSSFIAKRYFQSRQKDGFLSFITAIAVIGVALGTAALIIALSVLGGFEKEITEKVVGFTSHLQIQGFQNQPLTNYVYNTMAIEDSFASVKAVAPYVSREALIRSKKGVDGILLKGVDPFRDISRTSRYIVEGVYDLYREKGSLPKIVIGKKLATKLAIHVGDKVTVFGIGRSVDNARMRVLQFRVSGIYESGMSDYDDVFAFTALEDAQTIFQIDHAVTGYDVVLTHIDSAETASHQLEDMLGYPHYTRTVFESYRNLFSWIQLQKEPVPIILGLIIIVATVNIIGTLLMMVLGKTRDIGVLMSLGVTRRGITKIFLRQGITIAIVGTFLGNVIAFGLCYAQLQLKFFSLPSDIYFMTSVPIWLRAEYFLLVSAISIFLCVLSSWIPARLASRLNPVNAIRFA